MKVLKNGRYKGEFNVTCAACGCVYKVIGPVEFIFSDASDHITIYAGDEPVSTSYCAYTKCPECLFKQRFASFSTPIIERKLYYLYSIRRKLI